MPWMPPLAPKADGGTKKSFPPDLDYEVTLDTTLAVTEGMQEMKKTFFEALFLVVLVVFIFLQGWRATLIPLLAVPVSLVGTFALFPLLGFSINTLSLFGLILAIGLVVDDAIVVVEAVEHHIEKGLSPRMRLSRPWRRSPVGHGHCHYPCGGLRPDGLHPGDNRPALPAVRRHHCCLGHPLCIQRPLPLPGALRTASEAKKKGKGPLQKFYDLFNRVFGRVTDGTFLYAVRPSERARSASSSSQV